MTTEAIVEGKRFSLDPTRSLGKGGEADVYDLGDGRALKIFKSPDHPDYRGLPDRIRAASERLALQPRKLRAFPSGMPEEVVVPRALATDRSGNVVGYAMRLVSGAQPLYRFADPTFRRVGAKGAAVVRLFEALSRTMRALHAAGVVIGDFNDGNVLVIEEDQPRLIDADSFQFGGFACSVFTERFVDPLLCDAAVKAPRLVRPYTPSADWYAFNALLLQSLLCVGPYGGVHRPKDPAKRVSSGERPLRRLTIFDPEVQYPKPATPYRVLPDELLHHFHGVFERDERAPFPPALLERLVLTPCAACGAEHGRTRCPFCARVVVVAMPSAVVVRGAVVCERVFATARGGAAAVIVYACIERGELRLVHYEDGAYRREDGAVVLRGPLDPSLRVRIRGARTVLGRGGELAVVAAGATGARISVDTDGTGPAFDANEDHHYWIQGGRLWRDAPSAWEPGATERIGDFLANQTRIFVGTGFGIGFYRAGLLSRAFVFDAERRGINDELRLPPPRRIASRRDGIPRRGAGVALLGSQAGGEDAPCLPRLFPRGSARGLRGGGCGRWRLALQPPREVRRPRRSFLGNGCGARAGRSRERNGPKDARLPRHGGVRRRRLPIAPRPARSLRGPRPRGPRPPDEVTIETKERTKTRKRTNEKEPRDDHWNWNRSPTTAILRPEERHQPHVRARPAAPYSSRRPARGGQAIASRRRRPTSGTFTFLLIDVQKDFCFPQGSLYVGGRSGRGALDDNRRIAEFIYRNLGVLTNVTTTLDTHFAFQIFFPSFWVDAKGEPLAPFREISSADIDRGDARPNPAVAAWLCNGNYAWLLKQARHYCAELEKAGKYRLYLWPPHCILGSDGHALAGVLHEARMFHSFVRGAQSWVEVKGGMRSRRTIPSFARRSSLATTASLSRSGIRSS